MSGTFVWCTLFIWNPCAKDYLVLPERPSFKNIYKYKQIYELAFGFGCDSTADDYKVISIRLGVGHSEGSTKEFLIYTTRTKVWRELLKVPDEGVFLQGVGFFANGAVYWLSYRLHELSRQENLVSYFNIESEEWGILAAPTLKSPSGASNNIGMALGRKVGIFYTYPCRKQDSKYKYCTDVFVLRSNFSYHQHTPSEPAEELLHNGPAACRPSAHMGRSLIWL
ncbi:hypothetical protein Sjap_000637 [Stephania japonica]|uniref:F-box associated beta-propeller type 1 domain-containing protein n=1 Tax=Stephania japonica TaxID=461633 RepID=A0AAP0PQX8_9MAGN